MSGIVSCANTYHLFCVLTLCVEDMESLFSCKEDFHIRVNNLRHVVILFDALLENLFILSRWQYVIDKGRLLQSKYGARFITASNLSSALSAVRNNKTSVTCGIKRVIKELKLLSRNLLQKGESTMFGQTVHGAFVCLLKLRILEYE